MTTKSLTGPATRPAEKGGSVVCGNCKRSTSVVKVRDGKAYCPYCGHKINIGG